MKSIKNIVFDVGNVLVDFRYISYMKSLGFSEETIALFTTNIVFSDFWKQMDLGTADMEDAPAFFTSQMPRHQDEIALFFKNIAGIVEEFPWSKPLVRRLKDAGYRVYALSNYPKRLAALHWKTFRFLPFMDGYIIPSHEKIAKPDPAIYRLLEERFGIALNESAFIDDSAENVAAAASLGMSAVLFDGYESLMEKLNALLPVSL